MSAGFSGHGLIKVAARFGDGPAFIFYVEDGNLTFSFAKRDVSVQNEVWSILFHELVKNRPGGTVPVDQRVYVEGLLSGTSLEASHIEAAPSSTSSTVDATIRPMDAVTMPRDEFEEQKHADFKLGLKFGMGLAIKLLTKWASGKFLDKKDVEAAALRYAADLMKEERNTQEWTSYTTRPHVE